MNKTQNYYDAIAKGYKELYHNEQIKKLKNILPYLPKTGTIIDIGSADGVLNNYINSNCTLISLDLSFNLLKLNNNNNKINASITNLPLKTNSVDSLISLTVIQDIPKTQKAIEEISRILKKEGIAIITFLKISQKKETILKELNKYFKILNQIEEEKDIILILEKL